MKNFISFLFLSSICFSICGQIASPIFIDFKTGEPENTFMVDFDNDGDQDMLMQTELGIYWFNNLDGVDQFSTPLAIVDDVGVQSVTCADFGGDGYVDVACKIDIVSGDIGWFKNLGSEGQFGEFTLIENVDSEIHYLFSGDLDGDLDIDLIRINYDLQTITWMENENGQGIFGIEKTIDINLNNPVIFPPVDLDGDDDLDIIASTDEDRLVWYRNEDGLGSFSSQLVIDDNADKVANAIPTDFDNDGDLDLLYLKSERIFLTYNEDGNGTFGDAEVLVFLVPISHFSLADFNVDGKTDIVFVGQFKSYWVEPPYEVFTEHEIAGSEEWGEIFVEDFNGNAAPDIIVIEDDLNSFFYDNQIILGNEPPQKKIHISWPYFELSSQIVFDIDGDSDQDVICTHYNDEIVMYENEDGKFVKPVVLLDWTAEGVIYVDMNTDGDNDLLVWSAVEVGWLENIDGMGTFDNFVVFSNQFTNIVDVEFGDLDNDGDQDVVLGALNEKQIAWYFNENGQGTFGSPIIRQLPISSPSEIELGDLDDDGDLDIIMVAKSGMDVSWLENLDGSGNYSDFQDFSVNSTIDKGSLHLIDIDNNGKLDVIGKESNFNRIRVLLNMGGGLFNSFTMDQNIGNINFPSDMDQDGDIDLVVGSSSNVFWLENQMIPNDTFDFIRHDFSMDGSDYLFCADLDGDNDPDIVNYSRLSGGSSSSYLMWFENLIGQPAISGVCFWDENENGELDPPEAGLFNQEVVLDPNAVHSYTDDNGRYYFFVVDGNYEISVIPDDDWELTTDSLSYQITLDDDISFQNHFGFKPLDQIVEMRPDLASGPFRCSRDVPFWLKATNDGTTILDGEVRLKLHPELSLIESNPMPDTIIQDSLTGDSIVWFFDQLYPSHSFSSNLILQAPGALSVGEVFASKVDVSFSEHGSSDFFDKEYNYEPILLCSYDPNDKLVRPDREGDENLTLFDEMLEYTVRFQNTGNDTAFNVTIVDYLNDNLDWSTFHVVSASHPMRTNLDESGKVEFIFEDILLPDSTTNEPASHGFVKFEINPKSGLAENTIVENSAEIYFDFNPPIFTNTIVNTFVSDITANKEIYNNPFSLIVHPNPFSGITSFSLESSYLQDYELKLFNLLGQPVFNQKFEENKLIVRLPFKYSGVLIYQIINHQTGKVIATGKLISKL